MALSGIARLATVDQFSGIPQGLGRVVITHSTYVDGLIPWLKNLAKDRRIQTITPAVINRVKGAAGYFNCGFQPRSAVDTN